jgi:quercetin dioxygenase-like cupin family protein
MNNYNEFFSVGIQVIIIFMLLRSCFYLIRVRQEMKKHEFYFLSIILILGVGLTSYNVTDPAYSMQRYPFSQFFLLGSAWAFYLLTKSKKEDLFSISNVIKREYKSCDINKLKKNKLKGIEIDVNENKLVRKKDLNRLELNKLYLTSKKTLICSLKPPKNKNVLYKFNIQMLKDGQFSKHYHTDMDKEIYIDTGSILFNENSKPYVAGDIITVRANVKHSIKALERTELSAYLFEPDYIEKNCISPMFVKTLENG